MMSIEKVNLNEKIETIDEYWSPKIVAELNNQQVKVAKVMGEFLWHHHENEDELFYVVKGKLFIELRDKTLELNPGEFVVIPKGMEHRPYAPNEAWIMLFEPGSTLNTGNKISELTKIDLDKI